MTFTADTINQAVDTLHQFNVDEQLALIWFVYTDIKDALNPASTDTTTGFAIAQALVDQMSQMSREDQLQIQRDILQRSASGQIASTYNGFAPNQKLAFWYLLAQGMERNTIVPMPPDYQLSGEAQDFLNNLKGSDFENKINFMLSAVAQTKK